MTDKRDICERLDEANQDWVGLGNNEEAELVSEAKTEIKRLRAKLARVIKKNDANRFTLNLMYAENVQLESQRNAAWRALAWTSTRPSYRNDAWYEQEINHLGTFVAAAVFVASEEAIKDGG